MPSATVPKTALDSRIVENIVYFGRTLRKAGLPVGPASIVDAVRAIEVAGIGSREDFYWTLHAVFVRKRDQLPVFDEAFRVFWRTRGLIEKMLAILSPVAPARAPSAPPRAGQTRVDQAFQPPRSETMAEPPPDIEVDARFSVSDREDLKRKDFAQMTAVEVLEAKRAIRTLVLPVERVRQRRLRIALQGRIDLRRSLRAAMRTNGEIIVLARRAARVRPPPVVGLIDISGSMTDYSRLLLHFMHALGADRRDVHTFVFGTRLTNVTRQLRVKDPDEALTACSAGVADWAGGTRIATALGAFNAKWSRRVMAGGPIVLLFTDGLERDGDDDLSRHMGRLHRSCRRLIWLNPLLRFDGFEARARGVRAMLPHVDEFRAAHSLKAMEDLCRALAPSRATTTDMDVSPRRFLV